MLQKCGNIGSNGFHIKCIYGTQDNWKKSFYVKSTDTYAPTFLRYNNSVLAIVLELGLRVKFYYFLQRQRYVSIDILMCIIVLCFWNSQTNLSEIFHIYFLCIPNMTYLCQSIFAVQFSYHQKFGFKCINSVLYI